MTLGRPSTASSAGNNKGTPLVPEEPQALHARLARTAAPFLILRAALTLRSYAADQPLRGRMPQPLSQRRELGRVLARLVALRCEPSAIPNTGAGGGGGEISSS